MMIASRDIMLAFRRAQGYCECIRENHVHTAKCDNPLLWRNKGLRSHLGVLFGAWEIRHIISRELGGKNRICNLEVLCSDCYRITNDGETLPKVNDCLLDYQKYATIVP